ncbi:MAG: twin-arginine translocase TatA/TatE family subunit [Candidatus Thorarchaeota archaeon]
MSFGPLEIAFVLGIVLLIFGPDKLPQLARSLGKATREYQSALKEISTSGNSVVSEFKGQTGVTNALPQSKAMSEEEQIKDNAKKLGIETDGKTIDQLVDEILEKTKTS